MSSDLHEDKRSLSELANEALQIQDACNLSGLVHGWSRSVSRLRELLGPIDTDKINQHPINVLWANKVCDLARANNDDTYGEAYKWAKEVVSTPR